MDKRQMLSQIKNHYKFKSDAEFARFLGVSTQNMYTWLKRGTFDPTIILAKCQDLNPEWLLLGKGEMLKQPAPAPADDTRLWSIIESQQETIRSQARTIEVLTSKGIKGAASESDVG